MNKQLRLRDGKIKTAYWSLVGVVAALLVSTQAVFAADMWDRFSIIMKDIYGELVAISTIVAVTVAAIALLVRMISRNQRAVDEATSWLKRIVITWIVLNSLGFINSIIPTDYRSRKTCYFLMRSPFRCPVFLFRGIQNEEKEVMSKPFAACYSGAACTRYVSHGFYPGLCAY